MKNLFVQFKMLANWAIPFIITAILILTSSCKKADSVKAQSNLLTTAPWKQTAFEWETTDGKWVPPPSWASAPTYPPTMTLLDNNTFTASFNFGGASDSYGTWQLSSDKTQLIMFTQKGASVTATIATLTSSSLQLSVALPKDTYTTDGSGANRTYTYYKTERTTFSH